MFVRSAGSVAVFKLAFSSLTFSGWSARDCTVLESPLFSYRSSGVSYIFVFYFSLWICPCLLYSHDHIMPFWAKIDGIRTSGFIRL